MRALTPHLLPLIRFDPKRKKKPFPFHSITQPITKTQHYSTKAFLQSHGRKEQGNDTRRATDSKLSTSVGVIGRFRTSAGGGGSGGGGGGR